MRGALHQGWSEAKNRIFKVAPDPGSRFVVVDARHFLPPLGGDSIFSLHKIDNC